MNNTIKRFKSYLLSKGFIDKTEPHYKINTYDEIYESIEIDPEFFIFSKKWMTIRISNCDKLWVKCVLKDTNVVPYKEKEYSGIVEKWENNDIFINFNNIEEFGAKNEIPSIVSTSSIYKISLP